MTQSIKPNLTPSHLPRSQRSPRSIHAPRTPQPLGQRFAKRPEVRQGPPRGLRGGRGR
jgi:hypothetical protein